MRVVVDTNCLLVSIPKKGNAYWLYLAFRNLEFTWVISTDILNEYYEKISEFYSPETAEIVTTILLTSPNVELAQPYFFYDLVEADPDDNKFANLAISTNAQYLVSEDKHFNIFKKSNMFPPLNVIQLKEFRTILGR